MNPLGLPVSLPRQMSPVRASSTLNQSAGTMNQTSDFWNYLYQLQLHSRLCDMQLCIREVAASGEMPIMPIAHSIPVHKLVLTGSSHFFRRCLDSGELLDMYNFDGVQPQNLQLIVDYMYHQIPWDTMMANEEAAEVSRILEIIHHEDALDSSNTDQNKVLVIQMKDSAQRGLDDQTVNQVQSAIASGQGDNIKLPPGLKKGTRVFVKNLEEELKKHNIGRKKKRVIVLNSKFAENAAILRGVKHIDINSPLIHGTEDEVSDLSEAQAVDTLSGSVEYRGIDHVADQVETLNDAHHVNCEGKTSPCLLNSTTSEIGDHSEAQMETTSSSPVEVNEIEENIQEADLEEGVDTSTIDFDDMSIKVAREGSCNIFHVTNTSKENRTESVDHNTDECTEGSDEHAQDSCDLLPVHQFTSGVSADEPTKSIQSQRSSTPDNDSAKEKSTDSDLPSTELVARSSSQTPPTISAQCASDTSQYKEELTSVSKTSMRQYSTRSQTQAISQSQSLQSSAYNTTLVQDTVTTTEQTPGSREPSSPEKSQPIPPAYSTRFRGQKRVVKAVVNRSKRRKQPEDVSPESTVIVIQPEGNCLVSNIKKEAEEHEETLKDGMMVNSGTVSKGINNKMTTQQRKSQKEKCSTSKTRGKKTRTTDTGRSLPVPDSTGVPDDSLSDSTTKENAQMRLQSAQQEQETVEEATEVPSNNATLPKLEKKRIGREKSAEQVQLSESILRSVNQALDAERPYVCLVCNKKFKNPTGLHIHELWKHKNGKSDRTRREGDDKHECTSCKKVCNSYQALVQHMRSIHFTTPTHQCEDCQAFFPTLRQYRSHRIKEHGVVLYKCDKCGASFKSPEGQKIHMIKQHSDVQNTHVCYICGKTFKMKHELATHLRITHAPDRSFKCQLCPRAFKNKGSLKRHLQTYHSSVKSVSCPECFLLFKTQADMQAHHKKHFRKERPLATRTKLSEEENLKCSKCDKVFEKAYQCQAHERTVHNEKESGVVYVCTMCKKSYSAKNYLMQHIRQMHLPKRHRCHQCLYEFTHAYMLRRHQPKCKGYPIINKPYRCTKCNRYFNLKGNLTRHIRSMGRCRGATHNYADYIVVLSSDSKKGQVEGHLSIATEEGGHQDQVTLEALQASEALQQLQASGGSQLVQQHSAAQHDPESGEIILTETAEEIVLDQEQVQFEEIEGQAMKHEFSEQIQDGNLGESLSQMSALKDIISLPEGLKTTNIRKDEYGNMVIEVSDPKYTDAAETVIGGGTILNSASDGVPHLVDSSQDVSQLQQYIQTPSGELVVENLVTQHGSGDQVADMGPSDGTYLIEEYAEEPAAVQEAVEIDSGQYVTAQPHGSQIFHVVQDGILQQLVQTNPGVQVIQKDGTIQLIQASSEGLQLLDTAENEGAVILDGVDPEQQMIIKEELVEEVVGNQ